MIFTSKDSMYVLRLGNVLMNEVNNIEINIAFQILTMFNNKGNSAERSLTSKIDQIVFVKFCGKSPQKLRHKCVSINL